MYKRNANFFVEESEDTIILYDTDNNEKLLVLNEIGSFIFRKIENSELSEIIGEILSKYDIGENELKEDVNDFITNLESRQIIYKI